VPPDWEIVIARPATVTVAERAAPALAATLKPSVPDPVLVATTAVIHAGNPAIVQVQDVPVVTLNVPLVPLAAAETDVGVTV
jgi:hypothetical protein